jgi:hypothetical protein
MATPTPDPKRPSTDLRTDFNVAKRYRLSNPRRTPIDQRSIVSLTQIKSQPPATDLARHHLPKLPTGTAAHCPATAEP